MNNKTKTIITTIIAVLTVLSVIATVIIANRVGYEQGFNACIEENNLYERYGLDM